MLIGLHMRNPLFNYWRFLMGRLKCWSAFPKVYTSALSLANQQVWKRSPISPSNTLSSIFATMYRVWRDYSVLRIVFSLSRLRSARECVAFSNSLWIISTMIIWFFARNHPDNLLNWIWFAMQTLCTFASESFADPRIELFHIWTALSHLLALDKDFLCRSLESNL